MNSIKIILLLDIGLFACLICLLSYHIIQNKRNRRKTEQIKDELEEEREKTNKFHVSVEEIRRMTKGEP